MKVSQDLVTHDVGEGGPPIQERKSGMANGRVTSFCIQLGMYLYITPLCLLEVMAAPT